MRASAKRTVSRRTLMRRAGAALGGAMAARALDAAGQANSVKEREPVDNVLRIPAWYYQQFDADYDRDVPEEGFGGWQKAELDFAGDRMAAVVMHAWNCGSRDEFPGIYRSVPYLPRSNRIARDVFPALLGAVRGAGLPLFHVVGGGRDYYKQLPRYQRAVALVGEAPPSLPQVPSDPLRDALYAFKSQRSWRGSHNWDDAKRAQAQMDFYDEARPQGVEGVAENGHQLHALCREHGVNHLVYCGFAIDGCLLTSPGGIHDVRQYGLMCSTIRQATTAIEIKETARHELAKEVGLWRVALLYGFVFNADDFVSALKA